MSTVQTKQTNLREKLAELLDFRKMRDRLSGLGLYIGKDRTGTDENLLVRGGANVDDLQIGEIAALLGGTAVDVFVYDTSRDSDGGKWRERTQHTSWYNEELNTATRGARREFPAVAVIVAEANKVTIYDGDDPDLGMWMVFNASGGRMIWATQLSCVSSLNAKISIGSPASGFRYIDFVSEDMREWRTSGVNSISGNISERNNGSLTLIEIPEEDVIVNQIINDVAMTILPNAPIDEDTGLPVPTIAVACGDGSNSGFSIINHDGTVANKSYTYSLKSQSVSFTSDNRLMVSQKRNDNGGIWLAVYDDLTTSTSTTGAIVHDPNISIKYNDVAHLHKPNVLSGTTDTVSNKYIMSNSGLCLLDPDEPYISSYVDGNPVNIYGMAAYVTSKYNTGWMPGNIKLATLSDTTVETIGVNSDELINNGDFSDPFDQENDGWYDLPPSSGNSSPWIISGGVASHTGDQSYLQQNNVFEKGKKYALTFTVTGVVILPKGTGIGSITQNITFGTGTHTYVGTAITTSLQFYSNTSTTIDNVSVRATTELITNGDFSTDSDWEKSDFWTISSETAVMPSTSQYQPLYQYDLSLIPGKKYVATIDVSAITGEIKFDTAKIDGEGISEGDGIIISSTGTHSLTFVAESDQDGIGVARRSSPASCTVNSISVRPAEEDRSVNNNGLQIIGEINKTPVAPGADLVAYSGFSANDYLVQPYNEDLNFGAGDFCVMGWVRTSISSSNYQTILDFGLTASGSRRHLAIAKDTGELYMGIQDSNTIGTHSVSVANNSWCHFVATVVDGTISFYINGIFAGSNSSLTLNNLDDSIGLRVGLGIDDQFMLNGSVSLLRISATTPTPDQIAKIYRDEKALFQDGAQATLYGTSDAVTALAYDEKTELLHVGTASGRSDFSGLRRINNTTTAITTSISAHNNLIAEQ